MGCLLTAPAYAQQVGPEAALEFASGQPETARAVEQAIRAGDPWELLDWTFTLRPSILYRHYLDERGGDLLSPRLSTTLQVRFGERPLDTVRRAIRLERALRAHDRAVRLETRNALLAFAELLITQDAYRAAAHSIHILDHAVAPTTRQSAELDLRRAETDLQAAREAAAAYGMHGEAIFESLRFQVPDPPRVESLSTYRLQELALAEHETRLLEAGTADILRDLRLGVGYRTGVMQLDLETGLLAGRPGLRLGTVHPGGRSRMEVRVSAELAVSDGVLDLPHLLEEVELAAAELNALGEQLWADWLAAALDAELAEDALDLEEALLAEAVQVLADTRAALAKLATESDEREISRAQTSVERAEREVQRLTIRVYRAWITYVRRHHDMLEAAEDWWMAR